jgi:hypothetical protein
MRNIKNFFAKPDPQVAAKVRADFEADIRAIREEAGCDPETGSLFYKSRPKAPAEGWQDVGKGVMFHPGDVAAKEVA